MTEEDKTPDIDLLPTGGSVFPEVGDKASVLPPLLIPEQVHQLALADLAHWPYECGQSQANAMFVAMVIYAVIKTDAVDHS